ncbi:MAG: hypothetical protein OXC09_00195 [Truepera sp.]|nr:hypothetical protein [Truepera sp.]
MGPLNWIILAIAVVFLVQLTLFLRKRDRISLRIAATYIVVGVVFGAVIALSILGI